MVEKFLDQTTFSSQEDFIKNLKIKIPENFNFGYDIVDAWAAEEPDKKALLWTNDKGEHIQYTYADLKKYTDMTASYFQSLGIGHGDMVMLILKRRYEFWYSIIALHKLGAVVIPATHLQTKQDFVYRCYAADIKMIVAAGDARIDNHKYKTTFGTKAKMIPAAAVEDYIGHAVGGVCPFGIKEGIKVYLDESLNKFETVFPACGSGISAIELTIPELEQCSGYSEWVNVCKEE